MDKMFEKWKKEIAYREHSYQQTEANNMKRESAWEEKECKDLYNQLIEYAGGLELVRKGMRGRAKQLAISAYLKGKTPDLKQFKANVITANNKLAERKKKK